MRKMTEIELKDLYKKRKCPFCGEQDYTAGPCAGIMMNISFKCGGKLNVVNPELWDTDWARAIGEVLEEPEGYVPKKSFNFVPIILILSLVFGSIIGISIKKNFPQVKEFINLQLENLK